MKISPKTIAIIGNQGFSMLNFRGPLIEDLIAHGHKVYALAPQMGDGVADALRRLGADPVEIPLARTGTNPLADLSTFLHLRRLLARLKPDITLSYAAKPAIYGTLAAWLAGVPSRFAMIEGLGYVFIPRHGEGPGKQLLRQFVLALFRQALRKAEMVFFLNSNDITDFCAFGLVSQQQSVNIGGIGVDLDDWRPAPPVLDPVTFIFVGRLLKDKGVLDFISAARQVKALHPEVRFLLVGGLDENPESISRAEVNAWGAEGVIEWPGHVPVKPWLQKSSVFVLPSYYREGVPRSTQEAMALARPIITTDSIGCRETVIDGLNGYLIAPRDPEALSRAMQTYINAPERIAAMGAESRKLAQARFDVRKINAFIMQTMGLI